MVAIAILGVALGWVLSGQALSGQALVGCLAVSIALLVWVFVLVSGPLAKTPSQ